MLRINEERLLKDLQDLAQIGATPDGGVSRPALSPADIEARAWFKQRILDAGLEYHEDGAGNQSALLHGNTPTNKKLVAGSHIDTVPNGGKYDGALGALAALEALRSIKDAGIQPAITLEALSFTDEEGTLMGLMGSRAATGKLSQRDFEQPRGGKARLEEAMQRANLTQESILSAPRDDIAAFVELHIEQGTRLESAGIDIGVVTAIVGIRSYTLRFIGKAAHAGTTPMDQRQDALWGAADYIRAARQHIVERYHPGVVNFGQISAAPGAFNIVPAQVELALEFRHGSIEEMDKMQTDLLQLAQSAADDHNLSLDIEPTPPIHPAPMADPVITAIESAATQLGLSHTRLMSFAGHDTQSVSAIAPAAMLFVPSVDGVSHNPAEYTKPADLVNGANVVLNTLLNLEKSLSQ